MLSVNKNDVSTITVTRQNKSLVFWGGYFFTLLPRVSLVSQPPSSLSDSLQGVKAAGDQMNGSVTLCKIRDLSPFEQCWKHLR